MATAQEIQTEKDAERAAREAALAARDAKCLARAKESGEPVTIERWIQGCDGSVEECSTDVVCRVAQPDGSIAIERVHTH